MKKLFLLFIFLLAFTSCQKKPSENVSSVTPISQSLMLDRIIYLGYAPQTSDSVKFSLELQNQFVIRLRQGENNATFCLGNWVENGDNYNLTFILGSREVFNYPSNAKIVSIVNDKTIAFPKHSQEIWIGNILCKRQK